MYGSVYAKSYSEVKKKQNLAIEALRAQSSEPTPQYEACSAAAIIEEFLQEHQFTVKRSTYARYVEISTAHLIPEIGSENMPELTQEKANEYVTYLLSKGKRTGGGLSLKTVKDIIGLFRLVIKFAEKKHYIPTGLLTISVPKQPKSKIQILNEKQQERLETYVHSTEDPCKFGVYLCLYTGLRIGELCALRWSDIDSDSSTLSVNRTILRVKDTTQNAAHKTQMLINTPKTPSSERVIPLAASLNAQLLQLKMNEATFSNAYILTGSAKYIEPRNFYEKYKHYLKACELDGFNFHALRHTFATRCIETGIDPKALSEILGHASVRITLDRYVHPTLDAKRSHMERLFAR